ncbi:hypothetical protein N7462_000598 [Penicillium macrosclerotiorum]|uniref:uncharacterized protein n=1 Tax=Penicillium macrosclerotiorum TaxID=303699 RepID=UPI002546B1F9|nr:uncharacterized protein N7462_000598 [Penicillium macrosclerotiorum]KAJ5698593.1 hypothetical protein N7462_000598 [Penicillium macrosclerotiorum]
MPARLSRVSTGASTVAAPSSSTGQLQGRRAAYKVIPSSSRPALRSPGNYGGPIYGPSVPLSAGSLTSQPMMAGRSSKMSFFEALEQLDHLDESSVSEEDSDSLEDLLTAAKHPEILDLTSDSPRAHRVMLARAQTEPGPSYTETELSQDAYKAQDNPRRTPMHPSDPNMRPIKRALTTGTMPGAGAKSSDPPAGKKRKSTTDISPAVPEEQRIFKELVFFFFPNNVISPSRRLRIQRAREYGAHWATEWAANITHVIVEKGLGYQDLLKFLKLASLPENVALVNGVYISDCIRFRSVLSPLQGRFRVEGSPVVSKHVGPVAPVESCEVESLVLKPSRREVKQTPESSQQSNSGITGTTVVPAALEPATRESFQEGGSETERRDRDVLDDLIDQARAVQHLPLDPIDSPDEESAEESEEEPEPLETPGPDRITQDTSPAHPSARDSWARSFACMQKFDPGAKRDNPNSRTIQILQQMLDYYTRTADPWRTLAYRKAINALRRQSKRIMTRAEALSISGVGARLADKIEEIVLTDRLRRLDNINDQEEERIIQEFLGVYGAGLVQASKWVAQGYRSLDDLRERAPLTKSQRIGVERHHDFAQRIPRKEVESHGAIVRHAVQAVDRDMQVIIAGSYRRGASSSGDIDLLITKPDATLEQIRTLVVDVVVPRLFQDGFLRASLATSRRTGDGSKWHGASALPGTDVWRRIDLLYVPGAEFGAALLYFTGNDIFNRSMRLLARKKGMCLNQHGLFQCVLRDSARVKVNPGRLVEGHNERRIFAVLGVPWRPAEERTC